MSDEVIPSTKPFAPEALRAAMREADEEIHGKSEKERTLMPEKFPDSAEVFWWHEAGEATAWWVTKGVVKSTSHMTITSDKATCTCTKFKLQKHCRHVDEILGKATTYALTPDGPVSGTAEHKFEVGDMAVHLSASSTTLHVVSTMFGDISAADLLAVANGSMKVAEGTGFSTGRITSDLDSSLHNSCSLDDAVVLVRTGGHSASAPVAVKTMSEALKEMEPKWKKIPKPTDFFVTDRDWYDLVSAALKGKNVFLRGPSGCGKSELVIKLAEALTEELPNFNKFNMGAMSEPRTSLIGNTHFNKEKGTWFQVSRFVNAIQQPGIILLDEITRAQHAAFNILLPVLDRQGYLALDEKEDAAIVHKHANLAFIATGNVGMEYTGTTEMDRALLDRFARVLDIAFPPKENEAQIVVGRNPGLKTSYAERLCEIARLQREAMELDASYTSAISTRMLIEAGDMLADGFSFEDACHSTILCHFSAEGGTASERAKLQMIIAKGK